MTLAIHQAQKFVLLVALFIAGAWLATWFVAGPDQVTLIWPPAGIAMGALIVYGWRWWPFIPVAVLLFHLTLNPVPAAFIPFSMAANLSAALIAYAWVAKRAPNAVEQLSMRSGFIFLQAACVSLVIGGAVGAAGLVAAGMVPRSAFFSAWLQWSLGDLFGVVAVLSSVLIGARWFSWRERDAQPLHLARPREKAIWLVVFLVSLVLVALAARRSGAYALGFTSLPFVFVIWSAVRFSPPWTSFGSAVAGLYLATLIGLGYAGLSPPKDLGSVVILVAFLCMITAAPQIVAAAAHENRVASWRAIRRAMTDSLTGLANRPAFEDRTRRAIRANPHEHMALAYVDLDQFKLVNDTVSHAVGDELLRSLAAVIRSELRAEDVLARLGGDEFAVLFRAVGSEEADRLGRQMRTAIANFRFAHEGRLIAPTASIGVVPFLAADAEFATLFAHADAACYIAKELGGNRVQLAEVDEKLLLNRRNAMDWAVRLGDAIDKGRLQLYAQSIESLKSGPKRGRHLEILLRVHDPDSGELLEPGPYVAAAERFKFGPRLDRAVVNQTLEWLEANPDIAKTIELVSINLSGASVSDDEFAQFLERRISGSSVQAHQLCFEITETSAVRDLAQAQRFIQRVRALGCRFALDDFGAGFCSFAYLKSLDVDFFKIDGGFVREIHTSPLAIAIVRSIAEIARVMRKQTIAEYTESEAIRAQLITLGVDYAQGFAIDRPMPLTQYFASPEPDVALRRAS